MICVALQRIENIFVAALEGPVAVVERLMDSATTHGGSPYVDVHKLCVCGLESKKKKKENEIPGLMASIIFIHRCTDIFGNGLGRRVIITLSICSQNLTLYASY